jgi:hypothetical protein
MQRKGSVALAAILAMLLIAGRTTPLPAADVLARAVRSSGATVSQFRVDGWCELPVKPAGDAQLTDAVIGTMTALGVQPGGYRLLCGDNAAQHLIRAEVHHGRQVLTVDARVIDFGGAGKGAVYLAVTVQADGDEAAADAWGKKITAAVSRAGRPAQINTCLVGYINGKLKREKWREKVDAAGEFLGVSAADAVVQPEFVSISGYSPLLAGASRAGNKYVNLNMAVRFSSYENRTYVIAGSPAISGDY